MLGNLSEAWATVLNLRPSWGQIDTNPQFVQLVPPTDMVVLVTLEANIGDVKLSGFWKRNLARFPAKIMLQPAALRASLKS